MGLGAELALLSSRFGEQGLSSVCSRLNPDWVLEALAATGTGSLRRRRLTASLVVWVVIGMALMRNRPIEEVVSKLDLILPGTGRPRVAKSSISEARARLGDEPMAWLFSRCADAWAHAGAERYAWRGLKLYGVDGTALRVPDSAENRSYWGGQAGGPGESGYPLVRVVALMALIPHLCAAVAFGPYSTAERVLAPELWRHVPSKSLVVLDRGFFSASLLLALQAMPDRHWLIRGRKGLRAKVLKKFERGDELVEMETSFRARQHPGVGTHWTMRRIRYQVAGFRPQTLLTSLTDPKKYPRNEVVKMYHNRWEIELAYDEIKTDVLKRQETLRSKSPTGVSQEIFGVFLAHLLVRMEMDEVAREARVDPRRVSFTAAMAMITDEWLWSAATGSPGAIPRHLAELRSDLAGFILPERRPRRQLRGTKRRLRVYPRITRADRRRFQAATLRSPRREAL